MPTILPPIVCLKRGTKNNKTPNSGFDHDFPLKLLGATVLFVRAYHLRRLGQEVKKNMSPNNSHGKHRVAEQIRRAAALRNRTQ